MDKATRNALLYTAGVAAVYLGYKYYKKQQGKAQATTPATPAPTHTSKPLFMDAASAYIKNVKTLQTLLGVKADGIIGPITTKAAAAAGINYKINALNIDKAIAAAQAYKTKPTVTFPWWTAKPKTSIIP